MKNRVRELALFNLGIDSKLRGCDLVSLKVREGAPLASALAGKKRVPGLLSMSARPLEQTGQLPLMLQCASVQLSAKVRRRAMGAATILKPLLIVGMGIVVVLIMLAVLLPII